MRKCLMCKNKFEQKRANQVVCSPDCALAYTIKQKQASNKKSKAQAARQERIRKAEIRHKLETVPELLKKAQVEFNRFVRLRDKGLPCISCGKPLGNEPNSYDAGHYRSVGAAGHLRFDEQNVHAQCKYCNNYLSGNIVMYRLGLIARIGLAAVERLEQDNAPRKWDKAMLRELAIQYKNKNKELQHGNR